MSGNDIYKIINFDETDTTLESEFSPLSFKVSQTKSVTIEIPTTLSKRLICAEFILKAEKTDNVFMMKSAISLTINRKTNIMVHIRRRNTYSGL